MKYFIILCILSCGYGQYPRLRINEYGHIVGYGDTVKPGKVGSTPITINDTILYPYYMVVVITTMPPTYDTIWKMPKVLYGTAGIIHEVDSSKIYYSKFLYYTDKMNSSHGRTFARFEDSCMKYYKLLYQNK